MKNFPTKIVIRRLPPKLKEADFLEIVHPLPAHSYFRFCSPDPTLGNLGFSRAYITFNDVDSLFEFKERFDNYVFVDSEGNESFALVEFAVCQTLAGTKESPSGKKTEKVDKKKGTLDEDPGFQAYLKTLKPSETNAEAEGEAKKTPWETILEEIQAQESATDKSQEVTPLIAYLNQRDAETRRREDEANRQRKPFKQHIGGGQRKISRGELPARAPPSSARRGAEPKRGFGSYHLRDSKGSPAKLEEDGEKSMRDGKSTKTASQSDLYYEEFPAMQGTQQRTTRPNLGPWSDRPTVWTGNAPCSEKRDEKSLDGRTTPRHDPESTDSSTPTPPASEHASFKPDATGESPKLTRRVPLGKDRKSYDSKERTMSESALCDSFTATEFFSPEAGVPTRESAYRGRRGNYFSTRAMTGFSGHTRKPGKPMRGRRDSDGGLPLHEFVDSESPTENGSKLSSKSLSGRIRRGSVKTGNPMSESESSGYFRGSGKTSYPNQWNSGSAYPPDSLDDYRQGYGSDQSYNLTPRRGSCNPSHRGRATSGTGTSRRPFNSKASGRSES
ncbi:unnamed protein product [Dicrocoelium dendriticum]|nr:unnamed protein product [Dicrocoelium dendriticum]